MSLQRPVPRDGVLIGNRPDAIAQIGPSATEGERRQDGGGEASAVPPTAAMQTRTAILTGPVLPTLLRLALPTDDRVAGPDRGECRRSLLCRDFWATDALAGVALVFPVFMLMTMMSGGGLGSGVASAVARAIGAGSKRDADALVLHALVLAVIVGALFTIGTIWGGPALYKALGGRDQSLDAALKYSNYLFAGAIPVWIVNLLAAALRGSGNVKVPAMVTLGRRAGADPVLADPDFRARPDAGTGNCRRRHCVRNLLCRGDAGAASLHDDRTVGTDADIRSTPGEAVQGYPESWPADARSTRSLPI